MGAFELDNNVTIQAESRCAQQQQREECVIAQKIFDQCRIQKCLTPAILGPARAARNVPTCNEMLCEGDIIVPPCNAASVSIRNLELEKIEILSKRRNPFKSGCWDIELKYVIYYDLEFRRADGTCIGCIGAVSNYTLKVTLFGSDESEVTVASDLYGPCGSPVGGPFVNVEGKAVALQADLKYASNNCGCGCGCGCNSGCGCSNGCGCEDDDAVFGAPIAVNVTIGLFTIVKLFRTVNMVVLSYGNCVPDACSCAAVSGADACAFFDSLDFPMEIFSPTVTPHSCCVPGSCVKEDCVESATDNCGCNNNACGCNNNACGSNNNTCGCRNRNTGCGC